MKISRYYSNI